MKKSDQSSLLNIMETGMLSETKLKGKTRLRKMKLWIFATSNDANRLSPALRSRFMELELQEYTYDEFVEIVSRLLKTKYKLDSTISEKISYEVWYTMKSKDVRDAIRIAKLAKSSEDVDWLVEVQIKYGSKKS
jgi:Holliday junction DNA helicase RuvB